MKGSRMAKTVHVCIDGSGAYTLLEVLQDRPDHRQAVVSECFSLGPLSDIHQPAGMAARAAWWNHMLKVPHRDLGAFDFADHGGLTDLAQAPDPDEIAMIWCGANANEQILLRAVCHAWPQTPLWISEVITAQPYDRYQKTVGGCPPWALRKMERLARPLTPQERDELAADWLKLTKEDHLLRLYENGKIRGYDESLYDEALLAQCTAVFRKAISIAGQVRGQNMGSVGDTFLFYRIRTLVERGVLETQGFAMDFGHTLVRVAGPLAPEENSTSP